MGTADDEMIVLTGATGFVGSLILERLLAREARIVALVRAADDAEAAGRLADLAERTWGDRTLVAGVRVIAADLERDRLGLDAEAWDRLAAGAGSIIHCAASVQFDLAPAEAEAINVAGARRMVALAERARELGAAARFIHLSTAYVHGRSTGVAREDGPSGRPVFRNTYEQSKHQAEAVVATLPGAATLRPSIIVGDSTSGWTSSFNVLYMPLRALIGGILKAVPATPEALLDVVPVDQVVELVLTLLDRPDVAGVVQAVSGEHAPTVERFATIALEHMGLPGVPCDPAAAERIGAYAPYTDVYHPFELARAAELGARPAAVEELVPRLLDHAIAAKWGRRRIPRPTPIPSSSPA